MKQTLAYAFLGLLGIFAILFGLAFLRRKSDDESVVDIISDIPDTVQGGLQTLSGSLLRFVGRGKPLVSLTLDSNGIVQEDAVTLAGQAGDVVGRVVSDEEFSLALMVASEEPRAPDAVREAICQVVINQAFAAGLSITGLVQLHSSPARAGHYGKQITGRVASDRIPYEADLAIAAQAIDNRSNGIDNSMGATNFVNRYAFGVQEGSGSFADIVVKWGMEGKNAGTLFDYKNVVFFWKGAIPDQVEPV